MDGSRFRWLAFLALALALIVPQTATAADKDASISKIYPLSDLVGVDPELSLWIANTIPLAVQPGNWSPDGVGLGTYSYFSPAKFLLINHTPAVHAQVDEFLKNLKKTLPHNKAGKARKTVAIDQNVVLSKFPLPQANGPLEPTAVNPAPDYLVPAPLQHPKHLFHLIFRYEGDGGIDSAVTGLAKKINGDSEDSEETKDKAKSEPAKLSPPLGQLFHFIIRYEGDGLIDANVVKFMKIMGGAGKETAAMPDPLTGATIGTGVGALAGAAIGNRFSNPSLAPPPPPLDLNTPDKVETNRRDVAPPPYLPDPPMMPLAD